MAAKFFTGLPMDGPDPPECVVGNSAAALAGERTAPPASSQDHSHRTKPVPVTLRLAPPVKDCAVNPPLADFDPPRA